MTREGDSNSRLSGNDEQYNSAAAIHKHAQPHHAQSIATDNRMLMES